MHDKLRSYSIPIQIHNGFDVVKFLAVASTIANAFFVQLFRLLKNLLSVVITQSLGIAAISKVHCEKGFGAAAVSAQNKYTCVKNAMEKVF